MAIIWSIKDLLTIAQSRQKNKFDFNIAISGARGNGKSTLLYKFFSRVKGFKPWNNIIYSRNDAMILLESQKFGCIFDDEAIRSSYKRNFYDKDQKILVQMLNMYRDNFNIYGMAVPNFYALDKDIRGLIKMHIHVIRRGFAVVHIPNDTNLYSEDPWDVKYNKKIEENWSKRKQKNMNFSPQYHKLTTFRGYLHFGDLTPKQRALYEEIKVKKRKLVYDKEMGLQENTDNDFFDKVMERLKTGELTQENLREVCLISGKQYSSVCATINRKLSDSGAKERVRDLFKQPLVNSKSKPIHINSKDVIKKFGYTS